MQSEHQSAIPRGIKPEIKCLETATQTESSKTVKPKDQMTQTTSEIFKENNESYKEWKIRKQRRRMTRNYDFHKYRPTPIVVTID